MAAVNRDAFQLLNALDYRADRPLSIGAQAEQKPVVAGLPSGAHLHDNWELKIVVRGAMRCLLDDGGQLVNAPAIIAVPPGRIHAATSPEDWRQGLVMIVLNGDDSQLTLATFSRKCHLAGQAPTRVLLAPPLLQAWQKLLGSAWTDFCARLLHNGISQAGERTRSAYRHFGVQYLFSALCLAREEAHEATTAAASLVERAEGVMHGAYFKPGLSVEQIAAAVGRSPNYLAALFRQERGCTVRQALVHIRLNRAHELLSRGRYTVKEVTRLTGWSSQQYFANCFRRTFGYVPSGVMPSISAESQYSRAIE